MPSNRVAWGRFVRPHLYRKLNNANDIKNYFFLDSSIPMINNLIKINWKTFFILKIQYHIMDGRKK